MWKLDYHSSGSHFPTKTVRTPEHHEPDVEGAHPVLILDDVISYGGQRGPLAVVGGANGTAFMSLELADCRRQVSRLNHGRR